MKRGRAAAQKRANELVYQEAEARWQLKALYRHYRPEVRREMQLQAMRALVWRMQVEAQGEEWRPETAAALEAKMAEVQPRA